MCKHALTAVRTQRTERCTDFMSTICDQRVSASPKLLKRFPRLIEEQARSLSFGNWSAVEFFLGAGPVARPRRGDGQQERRGGRRWGSSFSSSSLSSPRFLFYKPSYFQVQGPHSKQLCAITAVILIGTLRLLDCCAEPNRAANQFPSSRPTQLSEHTYIYERGWG